jgi:hypothetical protein
MHETEDPFCAPVVLLLFIPWLIIGKRQNQADYAEAAKQITLRQVGHQLLLLAGDSTSRVLPIKQLSANEYQVRFEKRFTFQPDSLVKVINSSMHAGKIPLNYVVNVIECAHNEVVYGFSISQNQQTNIVPCRGRAQPQGCYYINILFPEAGLSGITSTAAYTGGFLVIALLGLSGFLFTRKAPAPQSEAEKNQEEPVNIGNYQFYYERQLLINQQEHTELTIKESKLLSLLAGAPNQLLGRKQLLKIWEDEGVIVGRSLDMFISKLRKKLQHDPSVRLVNIHGKGYKLEIPQK